jgi:hypothetical protein
MLIWDDVRNSVVHLVVEITRIDEEDVFTKSKKEETGELMN